MTRTPNKIKKGLECCMDHDGTCEDCPYVDGECRAFEQLAGDALALIQKLEADNAQQARCIENLTDKLNATNDALPRWISVEERLPKDSVKVLVYDALNQQVRIMYAHDDGSWWDERDRFYCNVEDGEITHWTSLPEPPKEELTHA